MEEVDIETVPPAALPCSFGLQLLPGLAGPEVGGAPADPAMARGCAGDRGGPVRGLPGTPFPSSSMCHH